jgi:hypothetical protein
MPAGLSMTIRSASSWITVSGMFSGAGSIGRAGGMSRVKVSPGLTLRFAARQAGDVARQQRQRLVQPLPGLRAGDGQFNRGFGGVSAIPVKKVHHGSAQS